MKEIYLIGSLRNVGIPKLAVDLRKEGFGVFDDWYSPGPDADSYWRKYEQDRGRSYGEALNGYAGKHIFHFDKSHLDGADMVVMLMPAGKSCHLEFGYMIGNKKPGYILFDKEPERWDIMHQFATGIFFKQEDLIQKLLEQEYLAQGIPSSKIATTWTINSTLPYKGKDIPFLDIVGGGTKCSL
jgi:hypothetical protein